MIGRHLLLSCKYSCEASIFHHLQAIAFQPRSKDTSDGSAQGESPCEVDSHVGLVDGRMEGRTGVHAERKVVLKCEGYNNEGACDILWGAMDPDSMT